MSTSAFDSLPRFNATDFQPPAWASDPKFNWDATKPSHGSSLFNQGDREDTESSTESADDVEHCDSDEEQEEVWQDTVESNEDLDPCNVKFSVDELRVRVFSFVRI